VTTMQNQNQNLQTTVVHVMVAVLELVVVHVMVVVMEDDVYLCIPERHLLVL
jgi:hypothetical protein